MRFANGATTKRYRKGGQKCLLILLEAFLPVLMLSVGLLNMCQNLPTAPATHQGALRDFYQEQDQDKETLHLIFSSSCSTKQNWQAYLFFHQALVVGQPGDVTRIVSGCTPEQERLLKQRHKQQIQQTMSKKFYLHFTPPFHDDGSHERTKYWNKPFGVRHWLKYRFGFRSDGTTSRAKKQKLQEHTVILVDPDMLLQKPLTNDFPSKSSFWADKTNNTATRRLEAGHVVAQDYSYGKAYIKKMGDGLDFVIGNQTSPIRDLVGRRDMKWLLELYSFGPPYIMTARDFYLVTEAWCDFLPRAYKTTEEDFMSEMYAMNLAALHVQLQPHLVRGFMISSPTLYYGEGWDFLDPVPRAHVCRAPSPSNSSALHPSNLPYVVHYCQRYAIGDYFFSKYVTNHAFLSCDAPLFQVPPEDVAIHYDYGLYRDGTRRDYTRDVNIGIRNAFMVCHLFRTMNEAARFYKDRHCDPETANTTEAFSIIRDYDTYEHAADDAFPEK